MDLELENLLTLVNWLSWSTQLHIQRIGQAATDTDGYQLIKKKLYTAFLKNSTWRKYLVIMNCLLSIFSELPRDWSSWVGACRAYQAGGGCITVR